MMIFVRVLWCFTGVFLADSCIFVLLCLNISATRINHSIRNTTIPVNIIIFALKKSGFDVSRKISTRRKTALESNSFCCPFKISQPARQRRMYSVDLGFADFACIIRRRQRKADSDKRNRRKNSRIRGYCLLRFSALVTAATSDSKLVNAGIKFFLSPKRKSWLAKLFVFFSVI